MDDSEILLETRRFRVLRRTQTLPDGRRHAREVIEHPGAVGIVPMVDRDHVCLIRNFRLAVGRWLIEIPAGTLEPGEPPLATASRELIEETGFRAGQVVPLCELLFSPGILHERMHLFLATDLTAGETRLEVGEQIERLIVPWEEALDMIQRGAIEDAKTVAALLFCDRWRRNASADPS